MEELQSELNFLKSNRTRLRSKCTRKINSARGNYKDYSELAVGNALDEIKELKAKLENMDTDIHRILHKMSKTESEINADYDICEGYEEDIVGALEVLQGDLARRSAAAAAAALNAPQVTFGGQHSASGNPPPLSGQIKLPQIPLPEYSHADGESFEHFITNFEAVLNKYTISNFEKFVYLERQVKGEALLLIRSLRGDERSYDEAKKLLMKAFADPTAQRFEILHKLATLNLKPNGNCYAFVSEMSYYPYF